MHKKIYNQAKFTFNIVPVTPLLIKSGQEGADPTRPSMEFIRSNNQVFIPGSSIKGVFRSYSEKILKTLGKRCCDIFDDKAEENISCSVYLDKKLGLKPNQGDKIYKNCCYACRTFGCLEISSHTTFIDARPVKDPKIEERPGVAIDRILGSAKRGALYSLEVVTSGIFKTEIFMKNFQLWQLGLIGLALRDLDDGYVQIGFAKSRGLGRVNIEGLTIDLIYYQKPSNGTLKGIGSLCNDDERTSYDFLKKDEVNLASIKPVEDGLRWKYTFSSADETDTLFNSVISEPWKHFIEAGGKVNER
ncbi:MAG: CRISPR-associated RAMP protein Csx7 [Candidatus Eremiobacterota bacterium]